MFSTFCKCLFVKLVCCGGYEHTYTQSLGYTCGGQRIIFGSQFPPSSLIEARSRCLCCYGLCYRPAGHKLWVILLFPTLILRWNPRDCRYALPHHIGFEGWAWVFRIAWLVCVSTESYHGFLVFPHLPTYFNFWEVKMSAYCLHGPLPFMNAKCEFGNCWLSHICFI